MLVNPEVRKQTGQRLDNMVSPRTVRSPVPIKIIIKIGVTI